MKWRFSRTDRLFVPSGSPSLGNINIMQFGGQFSAKYVGECSRSRYFEDIGRWVIVFQFRARLCPCTGDVLIKMSTWTEKQQRK